MYTKCTIRHYYIFDKFKLFRFECSWSIKKELSILFHDCTCAYSYLSVSLVINFLDIRMAREEWGERTDISLWVYGLNTESFAVTAKQYYHCAPRDLVHHRGPSVGHAAYITLFGLLNGTCLHFVCLPSNDIMIL